MLKKFRLLFHTVKYLKITQILYQLKYRMKKSKTLVYVKEDVKNSISFLNFRDLPPVYQTYLGGYVFVFLNQIIKFDSSVNWNIQKNGKLWNYNLQYANYLLQKDISFDEKKALIESMYDWLYTGKLPLEAYPVSLRSINILRWFSYEGKYVDSILKGVYAELEFLSKRPEYHLLGNHLLENAFALMMGGGFFSKRNWIKQGQNILEYELEEQILSDGAHFELSPMYHQIIFFRLLELIDWYSNWPSKETLFENYLIDKARKMLSWLKNILFKNGDIPHFNDSTIDIAYSSAWLINYAKKLGITFNDTPLGVSGYRSIILNKYECKVDFAQLGPSYQPGHAHSDALSFILYCNGKPLFVERGTSTYQIGKTRTLERSTSSHNTVVINGMNQSNIWSGFRVAERAKVTILKDSSTELIAEHDGYDSLGITHKRRFNFNEYCIEIIDEAVGHNNLTKEFHLHLAPGLAVKNVDQIIDIQDMASLEFIDYSDIRIENYEMANGYNRYLIGKKIVVNFVSKLTTKIQLK